MVVTAETVPLAGSMAVTLPLVADWAAAPDRPWTGRRQRRCLRWWREVVAAVGACGCPESCGVTAPDVVSDTAATVPAAW